MPQIRNGRRRGNEWSYPKIRQRDHQIVEMTFKGALVKVPLFCLRFMAGRTVPVARQQIVKKRLGHNANAEDQQ